MAKTKQLRVTKDAYPRGASTYRHWLSRGWSPEGALALVIGINPNAATDTDEDGMTRFLIRLLSELDGEFACGGYVLVNCCDVRGREPRELKNHSAPCTPSNFDTIKARLAECDFVVASWGTADYGPVVGKIREQISELVQQSGKRAICFSPIGLPLYCSQTNKNSPGRWSAKPVPWHPV
jgi:hypothetical protein